MLRELIERADIAGLRVLLAKSPELASSSFPDGSWPLHAAAEWNRAEMVELLVRSGAKLDPRYADSAHTPLSWAVTCSSFDAATKLVELGDEPDLFCASGMGMLENVRAFWDGRGELRANPSRTGSTRYSDSGELLPCPPGDDAGHVSDALYIACRCNRLGVARWLLDRGADPNWRGYCGATCLAWAEFSGNAELCSLLRERGGTDDILDQSYQAQPRLFPLMVLAGWGFDSCELEQRLDADPALVHARTGWGTLLHAAAQGGHGRIVRLLLDRGIDRTALNGRGQTAAELAGERGHDEVAALLLR